MNLLAHGAAAKRVAQTTALGLELQQQMEMTQLQHPPMLRSQLVHSRQVIHDHRANSVHGLRLSRRRPCTEFARWSWITCGGIAAATFCQQVAPSLPCSSTGSRKVA